MDTTVKTVSETAEQIADAARNSKLRVVCAACGRVDLVAPKLAAAKTPRCHGAEMLWAGTAKLDRHLWPGRMVDPANTINLRRYVP